MAKLTRNFTAGKMNKVVDERLIPDGQYIDALNVRMGSTELSEIGTIENTKGNLKITTLVYIDGTPLSDEARTIGAFEDGANETIYWFVHDPNFPVGATGKLDLIVSMNVFTNILTYHIISIDDSDGINTTLNFNPKYVITAVNKIDNLLFFSDDYNAPRVINVKKNYANPVGNIDQFTNESTLVIKKPPVSSPEIQLTNVSGQENFLTERFICFAYRYRYENNEYSAISQFSEPAFIPEPFEFNNDSFLNGGMVNSFNSAIITYNTGGPLVVGVDLLFKEMESNVIKVIEKLDKSDLGLSDNTDYTYNFTNSKVYTVLPESEILRLYDNVPLLAKAQTIMGNRLMYGNYLEGYDLLDKFGNAVKFQYYTSLRSEQIGLDEIPSSLHSGTYTINGSQTISNSVSDVDLTGIPLTQGSSITIGFILNHSAFSGSTPYPTQTNNNINISFTYYLPTTFASVFDMVSDSSFQEAIGTVASVQTMPNACNGTTLSDAFNCAMAQNLNTYTKYTSGINTANLLVSATNTVGNVISFQFPAVAYVNNTTSPTYTVYEYMYISQVESSIQTISQNQSLHSNRDYEIGIVYMDNYNRSTTVLVSEFNTEHVPCSDSVNKNSIIVTIPSTPIAQVAPYWATRYKFVIKADRDTYETIYSNIFFIDPETNYAWFLLEGENTRKVNTGDRLIVKSDSSGAVGSCVYATVLEKESQPADFLTIPSTISPSTNIPIPAGVYIKLKPNDFNAVFDEQSVISPGLIEDIADNTIVADYPWVEYPMNIEDPTTSTWIDYDIPMGSIISLNFTFKIEGGGNCDSREYTLNKSIIASNSYANMYNFWVNQNIASILNLGDGSTTSSCPINNIFNTPLLITFPSSINTAPGCDVFAYYYQFFRNPLNNKLSLVVQGAPKCGNGFGKRKSLVSANITVYRADSTFVFETEPVDTLPDVFFENNLSFEITPQGEHKGNIMNQNFGTGAPAVIDTGFFNCYAFGNGVESYKIRDSIVGNYITLGNRVTSIASEDYRAIRRYADMTYSGIYNNESNVNKLNEFNLGLLNFKQLERSFGPIYILDARRNDVLVLQEDKISYVLTEKNLLSDAGAGGSLTSVPEVLGTQIARVEKFGISFNPESYVQWGSNRFFTDVKRGAVINIKDDETGLGQLKVISDMGMGSWFRDLFIADFGTQKLGAWDPYLDEYVLSSNNQPIPTVTECISCGMTQEFTITNPEKITQYCVNVGDVVGDVEIVYNVVSIGLDVEFEVSANYDGTPYTTGPTSVGGSLIVDKNSNTADTVEVQITTTGAVVLEVTVNCPTANELTVVEVVLTANSEAGQSIYPQWRYTDGAYTGSLQSSLTIFASGVNPVVSRFNSVVGPQGSASIPTNGSTVRMASNKFAFANYNFDIAQDKFRYLRTNTVYGNNTVDINALVAASAIGTTAGGGTYYYADVPAGTTGDYLYLVWDFRNSSDVTLCYSEDPLDIDYVCCDCDPCETPCREWSLQNAGEGTATVNYTNCVGEPSVATILEGTTQIICGLASDPPLVISGGVIITVSQECGCRE